MNTLDSILIGQPGVICGRGFMKKRHIRIQKMVNRKGNGSNQLIYVGWRGLFEHIFPNMFKGLFVSDG